MPLIAFVAMAIVALVCRHALVAWFTGEGGGGSWSAPARTIAGKLTINTSVQPDPPRQNGNRIRVQLTGAAGVAVAACAAIPSSAWSLDGM